MTSGSTSSALVQVLDERPAGHRERRRGRAGRPTSRSTASSPPARWKSSIRWRPGRLQVDQQRHPRADAVEVVEGQLDPQPPGDGEQVDDARWSTRRWRPGPRWRCGTTPGQEGARAGGRRRPARRPAGRLWWARSSSRLSGAGVPATPGMVIPSASATQAMVEAVPMVLQWPRLRIIADSDSRNGLPGQRAGPHLLAEPPHVGAAAQRRAPEVPGQHRPARHDEGRQVDRGRRHQQRRDRLVAAAEQHHAVDRVGAQHLLGRHRGQVAPEHRGRPHLRLAQRHHRQVQRHPAGLPDAFLDAGRRPRPGGCCRASGPRRCWRSRCAAARRRRALGRPRRIHARWM